MNEGKFTRFGKAWKIMNVLAFEQPIGLRNLASRLGEPIIDTARLINHVALSGIPDYLPDRLLTFDQKEISRRKIVCTNSLGLFDYFCSARRIRLFEQYLIEDFFLSSRGASGECANWRKVNRESREKKSSTPVWPFDNRSVVQIRIAYCDRNGVYTQRWIRDWKLAESLTKLKIEAFCQLRNGERTFFIERIVSLTAESAEVN
jgi:hypothetical protein